MTDRNITKIKIDKIPPADNIPLWVRQKWVGLILVVDTKIDTTESLGVNGGKSRNSGGYAVKKEVALEALHQKDTAAAEYFEATLSPSVSHLVFRVECCVLVTK